MTQARELEKYIGGLTVTRGAAAAVRFPCFGGNVASLGARAETE